MPACRPRWSCGRADWPPVSTTCVPSPSGPRDQLRTLPELSGRTWPWRQRSCGAGHGGAATPPACHRVSARPGVNRGLRTAASPGLAGGRTRTWPARPCWLDASSGGDVDAPATHRCPRTVWRPARPADALRSPPTGSQPLRDACFCGARTAPSVALAAAVLLRAPTPRRPGADRLGCWPVEQAVVSLGRSPGVPRRTASPPAPPVCPAGGSRAVTFPPPTAQRLLRAGRLAAVAGPRRANRGRTPPLSPAGGSVGHAHWLAYLHPLRSRTAASPAGSSWPAAWVATQPHLAGRADALNEVAS